MDYFKQLEIVGNRLTLTEKCAFCRRAIPGIVERLKATRERMGADPGLLDAMQDLSDKLARCHRMHPKGRSVGLDTRPKSRKRFSKYSGRRRPKTSIDAHVS